MVCSLLNPHDIAAYGFFTRLGSGPQGTWDFSVGDSVPQQVFDANSLLTRREKLKKSRGARRATAGPTGRSSSPPLPTAIITGCIIAPAAIAES
jgi:hypothetical protein